MQPVVYSTGSLARAVRASVSLPGIFSPVEQDGHYLVDGGVMDNLPTDIVRDDMGADVIIAVVLPSQDLTPGDVSSIVGVLQRSFSAQIAYNEAKSLKLANIVIEPQTKQLTALDYDKAAHFIAAATALPTPSEARCCVMLLMTMLGVPTLQTKLRGAFPRRRVLILCASKAVRPAHRLRSRQRLRRWRRPKAGTALVCRTVRLTPCRSRSIPRSSLSCRTDANQATYQIEPIGSDTNSGTNAFRQSPAAGTRAADGAAQNNADGDGQANSQNNGTDGLLVRLRESGNGPPYLLVGASVTAASGNVTRQTFDFRLNQQDFGGYGSELRTDLRLGFFTDASTEYYRLLTSNGLYIKPRVEILRQPVYIYQNQRRIQERFQQNAGGSVDVGDTFSPRTQAGVEWTDETVRWDITSGSNGQPAYSGDTQTVLAHYRFDGQNAALVSTQGIRVQASAGYLYNTVLSENAPVAHLRLNGSHQFGKEIVGTAFYADSYFRHAIADPLRFTLGGPLNLSASNIDEYRGTDTYLARAAVLRPIASLPTSIGQGVYAVFSYEGGEVWSPEHPAVLRQDGTVGILAATPLGAITLGGAIGDAGRRKVFFTFGRLF